MVYCIRGLRVLHKLCGGDIPKRDMELVSNYARGAVVLEHLYMELNNTSHYKTRHLSRIPGMHGVDTWTITIHVP